MQLLEKEEKLKEAEMGMGRGDSEKDELEAKYFEALEEIKHLENVKNSINLKIQLLLFFQRHSVINRQHANEVNTLQQVI